jgi:hypothetical protein
MADERYGNDGRIDLQNQTRSAHLPLETVICHLVWGLFFYRSRNLRVLDGSSVLALPEWKACISLVTPFAFYGVPPFRQHSRVLATTRCDRSNQ